MQPLSAQQVANRFVNDFEGLVGGDLLDVNLPDFDVEEGSVLPTTGTARFVGSSLFAFDDAFEDEGFLSTVTLEADFAAATVDGRMTGFSSFRNDPAEAEEGRLVLVESEAYAGEVLITNGQIIAADAGAAGFTGDADGTITAPDEMATFDFDMDGAFEADAEGIAAGRLGTVASSEVAAENFEAFGTLLAPRR